MRIFSAPLIAFLTILLLAAPIRAQLRIDITRGNVEPMPVALPAFLGRDDEATRIALDILTVVGNDLERSGLFRIIDRAAYLDESAGVAVTPNFTNWGQLNAQALVIGEAGIRADGQLNVSFRLWDVFTRQSMIGMELTTEQSNWRRLAHKLADAIYQRITGEEGYFDTRVVYISEDGPPDARIKRLSIMDQDGANHRFLTDGSTLVLTPRFSPTSQEITYLAYYNDQPRVYLFNIDTGAQEVLGDFPGMTFAPRFSPDGDSVVMSLAENGNTDIYVMDLRTRQVVRLTSNPAIDTAPSYAPDGRRLVFESDRGGTQQLYVMRADGGEATRISFGQGRYGTPVWSPRGDLVAFTKIAGGQFHIGVMRPDGSAERILASGFLVEGPTWSPNGRVLIYYLQTRSDAAGNGGSTKLHSIDLTGANPRQLITPLDASDPAWSPTSDR